MKRARSRIASGFSLLELMIVVGILMAVAAMAIPRIATTIADIKLRSAISSASGVMQQGRMMAVKDNRLRKVKYASSGGGGIVYVDLDDNNSPSADEPQAQMGSTIMAYSTPTGLAPLDTTILGYDPVTVTSIMFNARGLPCSAWNNCGVGMVFYFTDSRNVGSPGWAAVSVSPAGRIKTWMWSGTAWAD